MKEETSVLDIFQDPLLTIIALILLGTIWVIIPTTGTKSTDVDGLVQSEEDRERFRGDIANIESTIRNLENEIRTFEMNLQILEAEVKVTAASQEAEKEVADRLEGEKRRLYYVVQSKIAELNRLKIELEKAVKDADKTELLEELDQKITNLEREIERLRRVLETTQARIRDDEQLNSIDRETTKLRDDINRLKSELQEKKTEAQSADQARELGNRITELEETITQKEVLLESIEEEIAQNDSLLQQQLSEQVNHTTLLEREISLYKEDTDNIAAEKDELKTKLKDLTNKLNPDDPDAVEGKKLIGFEAVNNKLYRVNENNYEYRNLNDHFQQLTKKPHVKGDSFDELDNPDCVFRQELNKLNPNEHWLKFIVRKNSFDLYIKARDIAWKKKFVVGWWPNDDPLMAGPGGGGRGRTGGG
ncbi:hypothetical protein CEE37_14415 [candidate division LCP-89 bacterium B3_LCP]|uniref:Uncharacterized protein n=1 Tax=candidate division LCP-89 bacterium B3_LCP TaxID=2012998 RepID=A0A532UPN9_UNCL8|nr:MAG: hypothetical protein CEE37_14415 [candidate division LCP-89 bacterium B3_LCP]